MDVRLTPEKGYLHGGEFASVTFIETVQLPANLWSGFEIQFAGAKATSRAQAERIDFRTFHFVVPDHGVPEITNALVVNGESPLDGDDALYFEFAFVDGFTKISMYLPENRTRLAVPLVVALGLRKEPLDKESMDRSFIQFRQEDQSSGSLDVTSIFNDMYPFDVGLNLLHVCAEMGLHQFADHLLNESEQAVESLGKTWQGRRPVDVARNHAHFAGSDDTHYASVLQSLEKRTPTQRSPAPPPSSQAPPQVAPRPMGRSSRLPPNVSGRYVDVGEGRYPPPLPEHEQEEESIYTNPDEERPRFTRLGSFASNITRGSGDSGFYTASNTSMHYADITLERQKAECLGTVRASYDYSSEVEEGMLSLKAGDTIHILSSADDGKWYGIVDDQIGFFYMTFVDHDNIFWRESCRQNVEMQRATVIRDSSPPGGQEEVGFLPVKVHDVVKILAMPDSGLYTAELKGHVGYIYDSHVQLIGNQPADWDDASGEDDFQLKRSMSIYSKPAQLTNVLFKAVAVKDSTLRAPDALHFKAGEKIGILDSPDSGIWYGRLRGRVGRLNFSDVMSQGPDSPPRRVSAPVGPLTSMPKPRPQPPPHKLPPRHDPMMKRQGPLTPPSVRSPMMAELKEKAKARTLPRNHLPAQSQSQPPVPLRRR
eukprot:m.40622 g.40622  ORF g.40622 m.40622 type:complete len:652 (+) comp32987_c0_seq1:265-2220(+)